MTDINYSWQILGLTKKTINQIDDVVISILWEKLGIDEEGNIGKCRILTNLQIPQENYDNFILYENLSKEVVLNWIKALVNEEEINSYISDKIQECKDNEIVVSDGNFPWQISQ